MGKGIADEHASPDRDHHPFVNGCTRPDHVARKFVIPYPILLVVGGLLLSFVPGLPTIRLDPDIVFLVFLPPLLWAAAYFTSLREFRANARPITLLAVGLVIVTTAAVATVAHGLLPGLGWPEAIVLGAIVSPPDAVSASAILKQLHIPRTGHQHTGRRKPCERCNGIGTLPCCCCSGH